MNVTIVCKINDFNPNEKTDHRINYVRKNDNHKTTKWYNTNNAITLNFKVHYCTVFNVNKLTYHNTLSPASCPQFTCNRNETATYTFNYIPRGKYYAYSTDYVAFTELNNWVKYGSGQSPDAPFIIEFHAQKREHESRDSYRDRHSDRF